MKLSFQILSNILQVNHRIRPTPFPSRSTSLLECRRHEYTPLQKTYQRILFSKSENFGVSIVESLSVSTPVVASYGTPWQTLQENNAGFWIPLDKRKLVSTFESIVNMDQESYDIYSRSARDLAVARFSWDNIAQDMLQQYRLAK